MMTAEEMAKMTNSGQRQALAETLNYIQFIATKEHRFSTVLTGGMWNDFGDNPIKNLVIEKLKELGYGVYSNADETAVYWHPKLEAKVEIKPQSEFNTTPTLTFGESTNSIKDLFKNS